MTGIVFFFLSALLSFGVNPGGLRLTLCVVVLL